MGLIIARVRFVRISFVFSIGAVAEGFGLLVIGGKKGNASALGRMMRNYSSKETVGRKVWYHNLLDKGRAESSYSSLSWDLLC